LSSPQIRWWYATRVKHSRKIKYSMKKRMNEQRNEKSRE